jgi:hypothetical protein
VLGRDCPAPSACSSSLGCNHQASLHSPLPAATATPGAAAPGAGQHAAAALRRSEALEGVGAACRAGGEETSTNVGAADRGCVCCLHALCTQIQQSLHVVCRAVHVPDCLQDPAPKTLLGQIRCRLARWIAVRVCLPALLVSPGFIRGTWSGCGCEHPGRGPLEFGGPPRGGRRERGPRRAGIERVTACANITLVVSHSKKVLNCCREPASSSDATATAASAQ